jgi:hypothetical protein
MEKPKELESEVINLGSHKVASKSLAVLNRATETIIALKTLAQKAEDQDIERALYRAVDELYAAYQKCMVGVDDLTDDPTVGALNELEKVNVNIRHEFLPQSEEHTATVTTLEPKKRKKEE